MIIHKLDLAAVRMCEKKGRFASEPELATAGLKPADYAERLERLASGGVIRSYSTVLVVPPLLGSDWVWAAMLATATRPLGAANLLSRKLPFVVDVVINHCLPQRIGPNLALTFYSRDFETEARFIRAASGLEHQEVYRIAEYSFPVALRLSTEERSLVKHLVANPSSGAGAAAKAVDKDEKWVRAKLDRLIHSESNGAGILRIQPEIDWRKVENFGHFHFMVETGHKAKELGRMVSSQGFELVLGGRPYQDRYVQLEADVWGMADLMERVQFLNSLGGVNVSGVVWNASISTNTNWAAGLLT